MTETATHIAPSRELLDHFFSTCETRFRFLEQQHGYTYLSGLLDVRKNIKIIRPYGGENPSAPFFALTRYELKDCAVEVFYGDTQYVLECFIYTPPAYRFSLSEILTGARKTPGTQKSEWGLTRTNFLDASLSTLAQDLKTHAKLALQPEEKLIERMLTIRDKHIEHTVRAHFQDTLKDVTLSASKAYLEKDFRKVISILEPYKNYLPPAELKKLDLAKKQLLS